jgi:signal transduction histidine kinase
MNAKNKLFLKLNRAIKVNLNKYIRWKLDVNSLQFRLSLGIIIIFLAELIIFNIWTNWEITQFSIAIDPYSEISGDRIVLLTVIKNFKTINMLSIVVSTVLTLLFIWRSLLPLRQINRLTQNYSLEINPSRLELQWTPSEVRSLVQTWNQLLTRLAEVREQQQQFTSNLAHELRTPLSMVYAYLQRSQQKNHNLNDSQKEALAMAVEEAERMTQILQESIALARADNIVSFDNEPLIVNDLVAEVAQMTEKFDRRSIQVRVPLFPLRVRANRDYLRQILSHLANNALKYSDPNEPIILQLTQSEDWAVIEVSDRGCGISLSEQSRIFEPFYRVDPSRTRSTGGAGLGLAIVKRLVESMNGKVEVRSEPGRGSTFIVKLPILGAKS